MLRLTKRGSGCRQNFADTAGLAAIVAHADGRLSFVSAEAKLLLGRQGRAPRHWNDTVLSVADSGALASLCRRVRQGGRDQVHVMDLPGGQRIEARLRAMTGPGRVLALFVDITHQARLKSDIVQLRADNQAWAQELQHRVRNTLHVLSAMMYFESAPHGPVFEQVHGRILAMAQAHDTLVVRDGIAMIDLIACIRSLHAMACGAANIAETDLPLVLEAASELAAPSMDVAVPITLIVHEVFSAAAKRAGDGVGRSLRVELGEQSGKMRLTLSGLCAGEDCLNLRLVTLLAQQLRAALRAEPCGEISLEFSP